MTVLHMSETRPPVISIRRRYICHTVFLTTMAIVATLAYFVFDRSAPYERYDGKLRPISVARDSDFHVSWNLQYEQDCERVDATRKIIDSQNNVWALPSAAPRFYGKGIHPIRNTFHLPKSAACGPARYQVSTKLICNWTHRYLPLTVRAPDIHFEIVGGNGDNCENNLQVPAN
jgi:hypothetical protein